MRYARVENGIAAEIIELADNLSPKDVFHPDIAAAVRPCGKDVSQGWLYDGKAFAAPPPLPSPPLATVKADAVRAAIAFADMITGRITGRYPVAEVASWPIQEVEARAVQSGEPASAVPLIAALGEAAGVPLAEFAAAVLAKSARYRAVVVAVQAIRDATERAIADAASVEEIGQALAAARKMAEARAADLGLA